MKDKKQILICGPCSAETEAQVLTIAHEIKDIPNLKYFRAGIWKPRTRPNSFEGVGEIGLPWLQKVQTECQLKVITEVAKASHVELALKYGIDALWIGARTTVNPFSVQEIADALRGVDIPVFVKNPINPDLNLWIGAIERLQNVGLTQLGAIHRGFSSLLKSTYRNEPMWNLFIEFKRLIPNLPLIVDPSHMGGKDFLVAELAQKAMDLAADGLMIETHISPKTAWSDADQQLTPADLKTLLNNLIVRQENLNSKKHLQELEQMRDAIEEIDRRLIECLAQRAKLTDEIGKFKKKNNVTILQVRHWDNILKARLQQAQLLDLDQQYIKHIYQAIHEQSIAIQRHSLDKT